MAKIRVPWIMEGQTKNKILYGEWLDHDNITELLNAFIWNEVMDIVYILNVLEGNECKLNDGTWGICKEANSCKWLIEGLNRNRLHYRDIVRCSFKVNLLWIQFKIHIPNYTYYILVVFYGWQNKSEIVCCADERPEHPGTNGHVPNVDADDIYFG